MLRPLILGHSALVVVVVLHALLERRLITRLWRQTSLEIMWPSPPTRRDGQGGQREDRARNHVLHDISFIHNSIVSGQLLLLTLVLALTRSDTFGMWMGVAAVVCLLLDWHWIQSHTTQEYFGIQGTVSWPRRLLRPYLVHRMMILLLNSILLLADLVKSLAP